jgi:type VI secretion system protein ImpK
MRDEIAALVCPVLHHGLQLRDRVKKNPPLDTFKAEQHKLVELLEGEGERHPDYIGDAKRDHQDGDKFLGIRYALACWLDEIFIDPTSEWGRHWTEDSLEWRLFQSRDRAWKFWLQAEKAAAQVGNDALEGYYLCVILGFRGEKRDQADSIRNWVNSTQRRIVRAQKEPPPLPDGAVPKNYERLSGREKMRAMMKWLCALILILIPVIFIMLIQSF